MVRTDPIVAFSEEPADQVVCFRLERRSYALRLSSISGVGDPEAMREVHGAPGVARGLTEWRGRLLTILDLPRLVEDRSTGQPPCLVRLAPPLEAVAFYLPAVVRLSRVTLPVDDPGGKALRPVTQDGETTVYLIDPARLVADAAGPRAG